MKTAARLGVLVNTLAGKNRKRGGREIESLRKAAGAAALFVVTKDPQEVATAIARLEDAGVTHLAVSGGDGSYHALLTQWINRKPQVALPKLIPLLGGSMNMVALEVGNGSDQTRTLGQVARALAAGRPLETLRRGTLRVDDPKAEQPRYGFVFVDGFVIRFLKHYYEGEKGPWPAFKNLLFFAWAALSNKPEHAHFFAPVRSVFRANGMDRTAYTFNAAATIESVVFGFHLFREPPVAGERFSFVNYRAPWLPMAALDMPNIFYLASRTGRYLPGIDARNGSAQEFALTGTDGYSLDGELFAREKTDIRVSLGPVVEFIRVR